MKKRWIGLVSLCTPLLFGCAGSLQIDDTRPAPRVTHERLHGALWVQHAGEYEAITRQTFYLARVAFDQGIEDRAWTAAVEQEGGEFADLPPAVIVDVDETVLDNSPFQAQLVIDGIEFSDKLWKQWVELEQAKPVPGAVEFLHYVDSKGVVVFYVTNRKADEEAHTRRNLERWGFPLNSGSDVILAKGENDWPSDKSSRRQAVAEKHRIVLLVGDDINDFVTGARTKSPAPRLALVRKYDAHWGTRWIMLPNPLYGSWEASLVARNFRLPDADKLQQKYTYLEPFGVNSVFSQ